jgi:translocator protein
VRDRSRQAANIIGVILQTLSPGWSYFTGIGKPIWDQSGAVTTPATPATYAFFIWSLIFATALVYAVYQALPAHREDPLLRRIGWFSASAFVLNALWAAVQQTYGSGWGSVAVIFMIAASACAAFLPVAQTANLGWKRTVIIAVPLGLLAGWITAASPINVDQALTLSNIAPFGWSPTLQSVAVVIASAVLCATMLIRLGGNVIFAAPPLWALAAIIVASIYRLPNPTVGTAAGGLAVLLLALTAWLNYRRPVHSTKTVSP